MEILERTNRLLQNIGTSRRLVSVGVCRDHLASSVWRPILPIYRVIIPNYRPGLSSVISDNFLGKRQLNRHLFSRLN